MALINVIRKLMRNCRDYFKEGRFSSRSMNCTVIWIRLPMAICLAVPSWIFRLIFRESILRPLSVKRINDWLKCRAISSSCNVEVWINWEVREQWDLTWMYTVSSTIRQGMLRHCRAVSPLWRLCLWLLEWQM